MDYEHRKRRSLTWLLAAFVGWSAVGALAGGFAFAAAGGSAATATFLAPTLAGVVLIARAFHEGRLVDRPPLSPPSP